MQELTQKNNLVNGLGDLLIPGEPELEVERSNEVPQIDEELFVWNEDEQPRLGKLKKTLKERCKECGGILELRTYQEPEIDDGEEILKDYDVIQCKDCDFQKDVEEKRRRTKRIEFTGEEEENFNGRNKKRNGTPKNDDRNNRRSPRNSKFQGNARPRK